MHDPLSQLHFNEFTLKVSTHVSVQRCMHNAAHHYTVGKRENTGSSATVHQEGTS